jgi:type II secretory pathway pseudopilin PulG
MIRKPRGGAMLASLIVIGVISLMTVATMQLANISKQQASKDARSLSQMACVEAGRQYVLGRLRLFGAPATSITLNQAIQIGTGTVGLSGNAPSKQMITGHIRASPKDVPTITSVQALPSGYVSGQNAMERSNVVGAGGRLGGAYRAVVACTDPQAGDMELEFTFQYGM